MKGRTFQPEFKLKVVKQVLDGEKRPAQICREHNISETILTRWQLEMAPFFEQGERPDGSLVRLEEVFHFDSGPTA